MDSQERSLPLALPVINVIIQIPVSGMASNSSCLGDEMKMGGPDNETNHTAPILAPAHHDAGSLQSLLEAVSYFHLHP